MFAKTCGSWFSMKGAPPGERWYTPPPPGFHYDQITTSRKPNSDFDKIGCTIFVKTHDMKSHGNGRRRPWWTTTYHHHQHQHHHGLVFGWWLAILSRLLLCAQHLVTPCHAAISGGRPAGRPTVRSREGHDPGRINSLQSILLPSPGTPQLDSTHILLNVWRTLG